MGVYDREGELSQINPFGRKMKLLEVMRILETETDPDHPLTANQIARKLERKGFATADRKGIYDDINVLNRFYSAGEKRKAANAPRIEKEEGTWGYYLDNRAFSVADLKLIIDAVQSSKFLSEAKTVMLIEALEALCSHHQAKGLNRQVIVSNRVKNMNASIHNNVDHINADIEADVCIRFKYFDYGMKMERVFRKSGAWYEVSPLALVYCDENYYLVGYVPAEDKMRNYRVDRMTNVNATTKPRTGKALFTKEEQAQYQKNTFKMYSGKVQDVTMRFRFNMMNAVVDKFGRQDYVKVIDEEHFEITVPVAVSPQFYGWIFGLGGYVTIMAPQSVRKGMVKELEKIRKRYE